MANHHNIRQADVPEVHSITRSTATGDGTDRIDPDGRWDLLFVRHPNWTRVFLSNKPIHSSIDASYTNGQESVVISFKMGTFLQTGCALDKRQFHELTVRNKTFLLGSHVFEIPTFDNAEGLVAKLRQTKLLMQDDVVKSIASGQSRAQSERTAQRHFQFVTGMTPNYYLQIQRALDAAALLRQGVPAYKVADELGYYDQFHLSKSLKTILGRTPSEIASG